MNDFSVEEIYSLLTKTKPELHYLNSQGKSIPMKEKFLSGSEPRTILSGSFNPIHSAHIELVNIASEIVKKPILFELSIKNQELIALKTAEGTANFITKNLKNSLNKLSIMLSYNSLKKFRNKLDPRKYNGAIFLGLQSPVVKSHGSTDAIGFAHSIKVCNKIVKANLIEKIESNLITVDG